MSKMISEERTIGRSLICPAEFGRFCLSITILALLLSGCSAFEKMAPTALPTIVLGDNSATPQAPSLGAGEGVTASGLVAPAQEAFLVFTLAGRVAAMNVVVGERVETNQVLAELEGQENLEAAVSAAQFALEEAQQAIRDLETRAETQRVQAMQDIVAYALAVKEAQYALDNFTVPTSQAGLDAVTALAQMKQRLDEARAAFEPFKYRPSGDSTRQDLKEALDEAQSDYNAAVRRLQLEYELEVAETQLAEAQHDYEMFKSGPDPDQLRLAEARQSNAQKQLSAAQAALEHLTLKAPFAGTVSVLNVHAGEWVIPGEVVLVLADLERLQIETTDLSERDVPKIEIGQPAMVFIEALNQEVMGRVIAIAPLADTLGGDIVYKTTIELETYPPGLRAGMSVEVQFETE